MTICKATGLQPTGLLGSIASFRDLAAFEAFEQGAARGTASVNLDGKMVDVPVYRRARLVRQREAGHACGGGGLTAGTALSSRQRTIAIGIQVHQMDAKLPVQSSIGPNTTPESDEPV